MTTTLILSETAIDYLRFMLGGRTELWWVGTITVSAAVLIVIDFALVYVRTRTLRRSLANPAETTRLALRSIKVATVGTVTLPSARPGWRSVWRVFPRSGSRCRTEHSCCSSWR